MATRTHILVSEVVFVVVTLIAFSALAFAWKNWRLKQARSNFQLGAKRQLTSVFWLWPRRLRYLLHRGLISRVITFSSHAGHVGYFRHFLWRCLVSRWEGSVSLVASFVIGSALRNLFFYRAKW